ncbi:M23 family metallopeptidase [bacterium]|nr:M23 family metallopeptidase [bacterium]
MSLLNNQDVKKYKKNGKGGLFFIVFILVAVSILYFLNKDSKINGEKTEITKTDSQNKIDNNQKNTKNIPDNTKFIMVQTLKRGIKNLEERPDLISIESEIGKNQPMAVALKDHNILPNEIFNLVESMKSAGYDFRLTRPGEKYTVKVDSKGVIWEFYIFPNPLTYFYTYREKNELKTSKISKELKEEEVLISGTVEDSIYSSIVNKGEHPNLVIQLADFVFRGGEIDFFSDCQKGDKYSLKVTKKYYENIKGEKIYTNYYGDIEGVYYKGQTVGNLYAFKHNETDDKNVMPTYFNEKGESIKRPFLKYPFTFKVAVSSNFGMRRDPVSRSFSRKHNGVDFPVPVGSPFISVAKGRVINIGYQANGAGHWLRLKHSNGYETEYFHLNSIKNGLREGVVVQQGEVLGATGNSGRSTGPHLHYGMRKNGSYVNPMNQKFDIEVNPLPESEKKQFITKISKLKEELEKEILQ